MGTRSQQSSQANRWCRAYGTSGAFVISSVFNVMADVFEPSASSHGAALIPAIDSLAISRVISSHINESTESESAYVSSILSL